MSAAPPPQPGPGSGPGPGPPEPAPIGIPPEFDPSAIKLTRGTSCVLCQQRKVRCDKRKPCANCVKARVECRVVPPLPPRRRKKRLQERDLIERLKKYETLLAENGVSVDPIENLLRNAESRAIDEVGDLENDFEGLHTSPEGSQVSQPKDTKARPDKSPYQWFPLHREFAAHEDLIRDSSDEELDGSAVHRAFDTMYDQQDAFPFFIGAQKANSVTHLHPTPVQIFHLWQVFINNVNSLLKVIHVPTVQPVIIDATSHLDDLPRNVEALLFSIYIMAVVTMSEPECRKLFSESKPDLLSRFHMAGQQALINAKFMRSNEMMVLQAYILFLFGIRMFIDPRQIFCYVGTAVRIGQRMGLHRDGAIFGLSPFEIEQRRRLWWTIVGYDRRIGEMTGSTVTALSTIGDCKLPLNINDADLHIDGKEAPAAQSGSTEMLFSLIRAELAMAISTDASKDRKADVDKSNPNIHKPMSMVRMAGPGGKAYTLDGFFAHIEGTYLRTCDQKIPLHYFTLAMTRQALCKMRVVSYLLRLGAKDPAAALSVHEKETLTEEAIQMIEYDNLIQSNDTLKGFVWYTFLHFPFPAYMYLVNELRRNTQGPVVDRAWEAIAQNHELRGLMNTMHNPMHLAFGHLFVKAWDARETALRKTGIMQRAPSWIPVLRQRMMKKRKRTRDDNAEPNATRPQPPVPSMEEAGPMPPPSSYPSKPPQSQTSTSPDSTGVMVTPPGDPGLEAAASQLMGYSDLTNDFGDMNWGFFMQGYDMNNMAGLGAGFGPYSMEDPNVPGPTPHDGLSTGVVAPPQQQQLQQPPPPGSNIYRSG